MPEISEEDFELLTAAKHMRESFAESIRIKSVCQTCGYQSIDVPPGLCCPMSRCDGAMREFKRDS